MILDVLLLRRRSYQRIIEKTRDLTLRARMRTEGVPQRAEQDHDCDGWLAAYSAPDRAAHVRLADRTRYAASGALGMLRIAAAAADAAAHTQGAAAAGGGGGWALITGDRICLGPPMTRRCCFRSRDLGAQCGC